MSRVYIRKSKYANEGYDVVGGAPNHKIITVRTKARAEEIARARRRVVLKRKIRMDNR